MSKMLRVMSSGDLLSLLALIGCICVSTGSLTSLEQESLSPSNIRTKRIGPSDRRQVTSINETTTNDHSSNKTTLANQRSGSMLAEFAQRTRQPPPAEVTTPSTSTSTTIKAENEVNILPPTRPASTSSSTRAQSTTTATTTKPVLAATPPVPLKGLSHIRSIYEAMRDNGGRVPSPHALESASETAAVNTVRYIQSHQIETSDTVQYWFNLSGLASDERLVRPELYINKRHVKHKTLFRLHYIFHHSAVSGDAFNNASRHNQHRHSTLFDRVLDTDSLSTVIDLAYVKPTSNNNNNNGGGAWRMFNLFDSMNPYVSARQSRMRMSDSTSASGPTQHSPIYYVDEASDNGDTEHASDELHLVMECSKTVGLKKKRLTNRRQRKHSLPLFNGHTSSSSSNAESIRPYLIVHASDEAASLGSFFHSRLPVELRQPAPMPATAAAAAEFTSQSSTQLELDELKRYEEHVDAMNERLVDEADNFELTIGNNNSTKSLHFDAYLSGNEELTHLAKMLDSKLLTPIDEVEFVLSSDDVHPRFARKVSSKQRRDAAFAGGGDELQSDDKLLLLPLDFTSHNGDNRNSGACGARPLLVDFDDLSFSDWIVEPKNFQSNYCAGSCKLPLSQASVLFSSYFTRSLTRLDVYFNFNDVVFVFLFAD